MSTPADRPMKGYVITEMAPPTSLPGECEGARAYRLGECKVVVSRDRGLWHLSISHPFRYPKWSEIKAARYALLADDLYMAMILPPMREYVDVHPNCFHLHEIAEPSA